MIGRNAILLFSVDRISVNRREKTYYIPIVIVTWCAWFRIHIWNIVRFLVPFKWALAGAFFTRQLTTQFTSLSFRVFWLWNTLTWFQSVCQAYWACTFAHKAHKFFIANSFIWLIDRCGAKSSLAITEARITASVILAAFITKFQSAWNRTAWTCPKKKLSIITFTLKPRKKISVLPWDGLQCAFGVSVHGFSPKFGLVDIG